MTVPPMERTNSMPGLGWLPDPPDENDWLATPRLSLPPPPNKATVKEQLGTPLDQSRLGSCVAQAVSKVLYASHVRQGIAQPKLCSRLSLYYLARATHKSQHFDSGTFIRAAFQVLNKFGFCPEADWPYILDRFAKMPPMRAFQQAFDQRKPTEYYRIHETGKARVETVKRAIAGGFPVAFGTQVTHDFVAGEQGKVWSAPPATQSVAGGHAMVLAGYDEDTFDVLNSWGTGWGDGGWTRISASYLAWDRTRDLWIAKHAPPYSE